MTYTRISGGDDLRAEAIRGIEDGQLIRAGVAGKPGIRLSAAAPDFAECTFSDIARQCLDWDGIPTRGLDPYQLVVRALERDRHAERLEGRRDQSYTGIVANVFNKILMANYFNVAQSWRRWVGISSVRDFKRVTRTAFTDAPVLETVSERGEIKTIVLAERTEYQQVSTRAGIARIPRQAMINDDLQAFAAAAAHMGQTCDATINAVVYASLTSGAGVGPTLSGTGAALFSSTHGNYVSSSGGAPSVSTLNAARKAMRTRTDPETGRMLNVAAKFLIVPPSLEGTARILAAADNIPGNPENLEVIVEGALESGTNGTTAWYLAGDQNLVPTYDVAFLGEPVPIVDSKAVFETDTLEFRARVDFGVAPLDYRGLYRNIGA
jgi:hypothetical protein